MGLIVNENATLLAALAFGHYVGCMAAQKKELAIPGKKFRVADHDLYFVHSPDERMQALLALIDGAQKDIRMFFYMIACDSTGERILEALTQAALRGVSVRLGIDSFGSSDTPNAFFEPLIAAGGKYHCFSSRWGLRYFVRNHQKILIADDTHALIGGYNITDQYFGDDADSWEDLGIIVAGEQVPHLIGYFDKMERLSHDGSISLAKMRNLIRSWKPGSGELQWLIGGPTNRMSSWGLALQKTLRTAKRLDIVAAYFSPSQTMLRRIAQVTRRNKGSRLVMAGKTDNGATIGAARLLYRYLLKRKADIYEFRPKMLHTKLLVIDDETYIGSANLDVRSLFINLEIMLRIDDAAFAAHMRNMVDDMVAQSEPQTRALLAKRDSYWSRFKSGFAYFLVNTVDYSIGRRLKFRFIGRN